MANFRQPIEAVGFSTGLIRISPDPIVSERDPKGNDRAFEGQLWINTTTNTVFICSGLLAGVTQWPSTAGVAFTGANLNITPGPTTIAGTFTVEADTNVAPAVQLRTNGGGLETINILNVQGTAAAAIDIESTAGGVDIVAGGDAGASSILINASNAAGGILIESGTGGIALNTTGAITFAPGTATTFDVAVGDLTLQATTGSVNINAGEAIADAIVIDAQTLAAGGIELKSGLNTTITSTNGAATAITLTASTGAGGITAAAGTGGVTLTNAGKVSLAAAAASDITVTGAFDLTLASSAGSVNVNAGEAIADAIKLNASAGGVELLSALQMLEASSQAAADAIFLHASNAAGGVQVTTGTGGFTLTNTGKVSLAAAAASDITVTGAFDLTASSTLGRVRLNSEKVAADAIDIFSVAGGVDIDAGLQLNLESAQAAATAIAIAATDAAGGVGLTAGSGGVNINASTNSPVNVGTGTSNGIITIGNVATTASIGVNSLGATVITSAGTTGSDVSLVAITGAGGVSATSGSGGINLNKNVNQPVNIATGTSTGAVHIADGANANAVTIGSVAGTVAIKGSAVSVNVSTNAATNINTGTSNGVITLGNVGATASMGLNALGAIVTTSAGTTGSDISLQAVTGAGGLALGAGTGGLTLVNGGVLSLAASAASNVTVTGAFDLTLASSAGRSILQSGKAAADAVKLNATDAAGGVTVAAGTGGIALNAAGLVTVQPGTVTAAGAAATLSKNVGVVTLTGLTTASAAIETLTITNTLCTVGSAILVSVSTVGAEDAQMTIQRVVPGAGSFVVKVKNNGAAALASNLIMTFWIVAV